MPKVDSRRVISLWLPRLTTDLIHRARRRNATPPIEAPLLATTQVGERAIVAAVDDRAAASGIAPGMGLADARALAPDLVAAPADPARDAVALGRLADWCDRYTPSVAIDGADGLFLDITGAAHLQGGEAALMADLLHRVRRSGLAARAGLADTPGAAWAMARFADQNEDGAIIPPGDAKPALSPLPVASLRLTPDAAATVNRVGLRRVGDLLRMERESGRAPLAARVGPRVWQRMDQALGRLDEPISPRLPVSPYRAQLAFAEPIATAEDIARAARRLLANLATRFAVEGVGARRLVFSLFRVDGTTQRLEIGTARPSRDPKHLFRLLTEKLDQAEPGFGIDLAVLAAPESELLAAVQVALPATLARETAKTERAFTPDATDDLAALVDRLGNRLGADCVWRLAPRESHAPERAAVPVAALAPPTERGWTLPSCPLPARPLRLFLRPEPVDMVAGADATPSLFRWRAHLHRVRATEGPERLAPEWWRADTDRMTRDYWRIEDEDGRRFWLFQTTAEKSAWFLHGEFA